MGYACREHLIQKVIEYATLAEGDQVTVRLNSQADSGKCDYCEFGKSVFVVMYEPKGSEKPKPPKSKSTPKAAAEPEVDLV